MEFGFVITPGPATLEGHSFVYKLDTSEEIFLLLEFVPLILWGRQTDRQAVGRCASIVFTQIQTVSETILLEIDMRIPLY